MEGRMEGKIESKKPPSMITAYVFRHGESDHDKYNLRRGITDKGIEEARSLGKKIADEIARETPDGVEIELRGFDSGMVRANRTLVEVLKALIWEKNRPVIIAAATVESADKDDEEALKEMRQNGMLRVAEEMQHAVPRVREALGTFGISNEARDEMQKTANEINKVDGSADLMTVILTTHPDKLKEMGVRTVEDAHDKIKSGVRLINRLAVSLKEREERGGRPKRIIYIGVSHGYTMGAFLAEELHISKPFPESYIPNCEGFRINWFGRRDEKPALTLWGPGIEKDLGGLVGAERPLI